MHNRLQLAQTLSLKNPRLLIGLDGWMDSGDISTGTMDFLIDTLDMTPCGHLDGQGLYLRCFPGDMEFQLSFRPYVEIQEGRLISYESIKNHFFASSDHRLMILRGSEPHMQWEDYADAIFSLVDTFGVAEIYFVGSVAGLVPHSREPRIMVSSSQNALRDRWKDYHVKFTNYAGPGSIANLVMARSMERDLPMSCVVAELPAYVHGRNPRGMEAVLKRLSSMLALELDLAGLQAVADAIERRLDEVIAKRPELAEHIGNLESNYDQEVFDDDMGDLKGWLKQQGIRLD